MKKHFIIVLAVIALCVGCDNGNDTHNHDSGIWRTVLEPDCETTGTKELHCNSCNEVFDTDTIAALGHNYPEWTAPTCETAGNDTRVCTRTGCGHEDIRSTGFAVLEHSFENGICTVCDFMQYDIGDTGPAGGIIFYVSATGFTLYDTDPAKDKTVYYLEAAFARETYLSQWGDNSELIDGVSTLTSAGALSVIGQTIGYGKKDTQIIAAHMDGKGIIPYVAAQVCANKSVTVDGTVFDDWFLPSIHELMELITQKKYFNNMLGEYWSSSQYPVSAAWLMSTGGTPHPVSKNSLSYYVHAVRAF